MKDLIRKAIWRYLVENHPGAAIGMITEFPDLKREESISVRGVDLQALCEHVIDSSPKVDDVAIEKFKKEIVRGFISEAEAFGMLAPQEQPSARVPVGLLKGMGKNDSVIVDFKFDIGDAVLHSGDEWKVYRREYEERSLSLGKFNRRSRERWYCLVSKDGSTLCSGIKEHQMQAQEGV